MKERSTVTSPRGQEMAYLAIHYDRSIRNLRARQVAEIRIEPIARSVPVHTTSPIGIDGDQEFGLRCNRVLVNKNLPACKRG
jgi:hypothetical protein